MKAECNQQVSLHLIVSTKLTESTDETIHLLLSCMRVLYVLNFGANRQVEQNMFIIIVFIAADRQFGIIIINSSDETCLSLPLSKVQHLHNRHYNQYIFNNSNNSKKKNSNKQENIPSKVRTYKDKLKHYFRITSHESRPRGHTAMHKLGCEIDSRLHEFCFLCCFSRIHEWANEHALLWPPGMGMSVSFPLRVNSNHNSDRLHF